MNRAVLLKIRRELIAIVSIVLLVAPFISGCVQAQSTLPSRTEIPAGTMPITGQTPSPTTPVSPPPPAAPSKPVVAKLTFSEPPALGKPVQLIANITITEKATIERADNASAEIILPEGVELVSGNLKGTLNIVKGMPSQFRATIKSIKTGDFSFEFVLFYHSPGSVGNLGVARAYIYARIEQNSTEVSDIPFSPAGIPNPSPAPPPPGRENEPAPVQPTDKSASPQQPSVSPPQAPTAPFSFDLSFPDGAPPLNQIAVLKGVAIHRTRVMNNVRIDLILPEGFELISGNPMYSTDSLPYGEIVAIVAQVKAIKIGNWTIEARLKEGDVAAYSEGGARYLVYVSVGEKTAEWRLNPPYGNAPSEPVTRDGQPIKPVQPPVSN